MTSVYLIDENAVWVDTLDLDLDAGRPLNTVLDAPPEFDPEISFAAWSGTKWLVRPIADLPAAPEPPPPPVPEEVTRRQAKTALSRAQLLSAADAAIAAMPGQAGEEARIDWADAGVFRRDNPLITAMGEALGLAPDAVDDLFRSAARL